MLVRFMYLTLILCITYQAFTADDAFLERHRKAVANNPEGVTFTISTENGQTAFHMGEEIPLVLSFSSSKTDTYSLNKSTHPFHVRYNECFEIHPTCGIREPFATVFHRCSFIMDMYSYSHFGPMRIPPPLSPEPIKVPVVLNEWKRIEKPGEYQIYVTSKRVSKGLKPSFIIFSTTGVLSTSSNILQIEILPDDPKWKSEQCNTAVQFIQSATDPASIKQAYRALWFLDTEEAIDALIQGVSRDEYLSTTGNICKKGLYASSHKKVILDRMEETLGRPDFESKRAFLDVLSTIRLCADDPELELYEDATDKEYWRQCSMKHRQLCLEYALKKVADDSVQDAAVKARNYKTLIDILRATSEDLLNEESRKRVEEFPQVVKTAFHQLSAAEQTRLITDYAEYLAIPDMLPIYLDVYRKPKRNPYDSTGALLDIALTRIYQLDPEQGRKLMIDEIKSPLPRASLKCLEQLPDRELPGIDRVVASHLLSCYRTSRRTGEIHVDGMKMREYIQTLERFGSSEVLEDMKGVYIAPILRKNSMWDEIAVLLLSYFLRVNESFAVKLIEDLVQDTDVDGSSILRRISQIRPHPILERFLIPYLEDRDSQKVYYTVSWLDRNGTLACKQPLWDCLERWSKQWRGKESELTTDDLFSDTWLQTRLGPDLIKALTYQPCWMLNLDELKQIQPMCLTEPMKKCVEECIKNYGKTLSLSISTDYRSKKKPRPVNLYIPMKSNYVYYGNYTQEMFWNKLAQHPKGTIFEYHLDSELKEHEADAFIEKLRQYLEGMGMILRKEGD